VRVLFDQGTPVPLRQFLTDHHVETAFERGWQLLRNGDLLDAAEANGFDCFVTTDQNLRFEQNLTLRRLAIVVLPTTDWRLIRAHTDGVGAAVAAASAGDCVEVRFPPSGDRAE
jgi:hypothetical protein